MPRFHRTYREHTGKGTLLVPPGRKVQNGRRQRQIGEERKNREVQKEIAFLEFVRNNPGANSREAYRAIGMHQIPGSDIRDGLEAGNFIRVDKEYPGQIGTRTQLLITQRGLDYLHGKLWEETNEPQTTS